MHRLVLCAVATVIFAGCRQETVTNNAPPPVRTSTASQKPQSLDKAAVNQVLPLNAADSLATSHLGSPGSPDGAVTADKDSFKSGDPISLTVTVKDAPKGVRLAARWYDAKGKQLAEEMKVLNGEASATFKWSGKKLKAGKYRVVSLWGENVAGEHAFTVTK